MGEWLLSRRDSTIFMDAESAPSLASGRVRTPFRNAIATNSLQVSTFEEMRQE